MGGAETLLVYSSTHSNRYDVELSSRFESKVFRGKVSNQNRVYSSNCLETGGSFAKFVKAPS